MRMIGFSKQYIICIFLRKLNYFSSPSTIIAKKPARHHDHWQLPLAVPLVSI